MKFVCYTDWDQLPDSANMLFAHGAQENLFLSRPWFENLSANLDEGHSMILACVVAGNDVLAILPLQKSTANNFHSLKHRYSTHYSLLLAGTESDQDQQQVLTCLVQGLSQLPLDSLLLEPIADDDNRLAILQEIMQTAGYRCERYFRFYNWVYHLQGQTFDDYMASRPARLRNTISRKKRKLAREHEYHIRLFTGDQVPQAMSDYDIVYTSSWKATEQNTGFMHDIVAEFSRRGWSRLAVLYVKAQPVAAQLWFVLHGKASIFRLVYDEAWKQYSPGSILTSFLMEYVINTDRVQEIDFLTGNEAYKQDWMSNRRERFALSCIKTRNSAGMYSLFISYLKRIFKSR